MNASRITLTVLLVFASLLTLTPVAAAEGTIVDVAVADGRFTTLVAALQAADLVETLQGDGPFTVFAPTDDAFGALPEGTIPALLDDVPTLTNILLYHVVSGKVLAADVANLTGANTVLNEAVSVRVMDGSVYINGSQVIITDIETSNGVIHVIDAVLLPPTQYTVSAGDTLSGIAGRLLNDAHRYRDIMALTNAAYQFDNTYAHIVNANLIEIGDKLSIPGYLGATQAEPPAAPTPEAPSAATQSIVEIAVADGRFTTLVAALQAADLVETLQGEGPFTVFAPTDDAFNALPEGTIPALLDDIPTLTDILLYHVVSGKVMAADVVNLSYATTVQGAPALIVVSGDLVRVDSARVIITDIEATNGVIHVIDAVMLPPTEYTVVAGDTLYGIAARELGNGNRYTEIVTLTNLMAETDSSYATISNPNLIEVGWKLALP